MNITTESKVELSRDEVQAILKRAIEEKYRYCEIKPRGKLSNWSHLGNGGGLLVCFKETEEPEADEAAPIVTESEPPPPLPAVPSRINETTAADF